MQKSMIIFIVLVTSFSSSFSARGKSDHLRMAMPLLGAVGGAIKTAVQKPNVPVINGAVEGAAWGVFQVIAIDLWVESQRRKKTDFYDVSR